MFPQPQLFKEMVGVACASLVWQGVGLWLLHQAVEQAKQQSEAAKRWPLPGAWLRKRGALWWQRPHLRDDVAHAFQGP